MKKRMKWWVLGSILLLTSQLSIAVIYKILGIENTSDAESHTMNLLSNPLLLLFAFCLSPIIEEFIFRYLLYRKNMKQPLNLITALVSSYLFGLIHDKTMIMTIPLIINGLIYCLIYKKSESIWISIASHSTFNILIFIIITMSN